MGDKLTETRQKLLQLVRAVTNDTEVDPGRVLDLGFVAETIPQEYSPQPGRNRLYLVGDEARLFREIEEALPLDRAFEYLKPAAVRKILWKLVFEATISERPARSQEEARELTDAFMSEHARVSVAFHVIAEIYGLELDAGSISVGDVEFMRMDASDLRQWGLTNERALGRVKGRLFAKCEEMGTNPDLAIQRAWPRIDNALDLVATGLVAGRPLPDDQLLFERGATSFAKAPAGTVTGWWQRPLLPSTLSLRPSEAQDLKAEIQILEQTLSDPNLSKKMRDQLLIAVTWVRKAVRARDYSDRVNCLFTALEALYQTKNDGKKAEGLAVRIDLAELADMGWCQSPMLALELYEELRSRSLHGEKLRTVSKEDYKDALDLALTGVGIFCRLVRTHRFKNRTAFFAWLLEGDRPALFLAFMQDIDEHFPTASKDTSRLKGWIDGQFAAREAAPG